MKLTPEQKKQKKQRDNLEIIHNRILSAFHLKQIKTWRDLYVYQGYDETIITQFQNHSLGITYLELKEYIKREKEALEKSFLPAPTETINTTLISYENEVTREERATVEREDKLSTQSSSSETDLVSNISSHQYPTHIITYESDQDEQRASLVAESLGESASPVAEAKELVIEDKPPVDTEKRDNYGYTRQDKIKCFLYWFQKKAVAELYHKIVVQKKSGVLLLAPTGVGKTYITDALIEWLWSIGWHENSSWSHIPYLIITKATILEQQARVLNNNFPPLRANIDIEITNIESLRANSGQLWLKREIVIENGVEVEKWIWKKRMHPRAMFLDESQGAKNKGSTQSQIIYAYNDIPDNACLVSISATPFTRVSEAQAFAVSTHRDISHLGFPAGTKLNNKNWPAYAACIAHPSKPDEFNQAAVDRLIDDLEPWIVRVRGVRPQFEAQNGVKVIQFETPEKQKYYEEAWERFCRDMAKLKMLEEENDSKSVGVCRLAILTRFSVAAEFCHADGFADMMYHDVQEGFAAVAAVKNKGTLIQIVKRLESRGVSRDQISLIWGGGQTMLTKKQKAKEKIKAMKDKLAKAGMSVDEMIELAGLEETEDRVLVDLPPHLRLGNQDKKERQREIDAFQSGKTLYCIYTLKSGGVGLSLHHTDEMTEFKCRRKPSGYAVEEDIPKVPVRQRTTIVTVTYNAIELVQGVGRVPRLTSLSPTRQWVICYAGTVEVDMGRVYSQKLRCLSSVVRMKESWQDIIMSANNRNMIVEQKLKTTANVADDESTLINEGDTNEEDEEDNGFEEGTGEEWKG